PKLSGKLMGIAAIQYLISLFVLVPMFGLNGGAISLTLTSATSLVLMPVFIKRTLKIDIFEGLPKVLASGAVLGILLVIMNMYISNFGLLLLGTFAGVVVYGLLLYYTGYVTKEDINMIRNPKTQNSENGNQQTDEQ
ncbi:MAG: polysaccharide biosynthesis C-terminal domain-containing protein, partial [Candidatus Bathyarchaeota archaeon]|nr:polysaccharide biosynthesis C-terminal domain-containing protein [Candidatus Bathyarchaeota archaeon]